VRGLIASKSAIATIAGIDDIRVGLVFRAVRGSKRKRQVDVAVAAA
jgi:hypothetical protein